MLKKYLWLTLYTLFVLCSLPIWAEKTTEPAFTVQVLGQGKPIILIPGLMSDQRVWQQTAQQLKNNYQMHLINLAGFAGKEPLQHQLQLQEVNSQLADYIQHNKLNRPVIIGHSLGGFLAFQLASTHPTLTGKIISVDGLPFLAPIFTHDSNTSATQMEAQAKMLEQYYRQMSSTQLMESAKQAMEIQTNQLERVDTMLEMAKTSDPATVGTVIAQLLTTDLRSEVHKIQQPVLLLGAGGALPSPAMRPAVQTIYQQQIATIPNARLDFNWQSRHFVMWDKPEWLLQQITDFIKE